MDIINHLDYGKCIFLSCLINSKMHFLLFILILFLLCLVIGCIGGVIYAIAYKPVKWWLKQNNRFNNKTVRLINTVYLSSLFIVAFYFTYDAFYPSENYYAEEFKTVTLRELPNSAEFVEKSTSYPDFHGDYCSSSQIKLSKEDFRKLFNEINHDKRIIKSGEIQSKNKHIKYSFSRKIENQEDQHLFIGFCDDGKTVFINIYVI